MKKTLLIGLLLWNSSLLLGQPANRDSLRALIASYSEDSIGIHARRQLAIDITLFSPDSISYSIELTNAAIERANAQNIYSEEMNGYYDRAWMYYLQGDLTTSKRDYQKAIELAKAIGDDYSYYLFRDKLTTILFEEGKKDEGLEIKYESLDYFKSINDTFQILNCLGLLGHAYFFYNEFEKGKEIIFEKLSYNYIYPGTIEDYGNLGIAYYELGDLDSAVYYMQLAGEMGEDYPFFMIANQMYLAKVLHKKGDKEEAIAVLEELNTTYGDLDEKNLYELKMLLSEYYLELGKLEESSNYFKEIEQGLLSQDLQTQQKKSYLGYKINQQKGNFQQALQFYQAYHTASDSINAVRRDSAYQVIESKYQLAKKDEEIITQQLQLRNLWFILLAVGAVLGTTVIGLYLRQRNQKYKADLLAEKTRSQELEIEGLQREKQLISMRSILEGQEAERKRIARDLHDNIGSMMAAIKIKLQTIPESNTQLDSMVGQVSEEVRRISHNMTPLAFGLSGLKGAIDDLCQMLKQHHIQVQNQLNGLEHLQREDRQIMFFRILQEMIHNIIKHAEASEVRLTGYIQDDTLEVTIRDNGNSLPESVWAESQSLGIKNIKSRVNYLQGSIALDNSEGTCFHLTIPLSI